MTPERQMLHRSFAEALGCASDEDYRIKKDVLIQYLRSTQPQYFTLEGGRRRAFEHMAKIEGVTVEDKLEDFALLDYVMRRSFTSTSKQEALEALSTSGIPDEDRPLVEKLIGELYR